MHRLQYIPNHFIIPLPIFCNLPLLCSIHPFNHVPPVDALSPTEHSQSIPDDAVGAVLYPEEVEEEVGDAGSCPDVGGGCGVGRR